MPSRKLIVYISMSLDGFIADKNGNLDFLSIVEQSGQDYGYTDFAASVDTIIIGRKTYDKVISMGYEYPHTDKDVYIITRSPRPSIGTFQFYTGDLPGLVTSLKAKSSRNIYCDGGAEVVNQLLAHSLVDEMIISVIPILLGSGVSLFNGNGKTQKLQLISEQSFEKGLVQLHYKLV